MQWWPLNWILQFLRASFTALRNELIFHYEVVEMIDLYFWRTSHDIDRCVRAAVTFDSLWLTKLMAGWFSPWPSCDFGGNTIEVIYRVPFILPREMMPAKSRIVVKEFMFLPLCKGATWVFFEDIAWIGNESQHDEEVFQKWLLAGDAWYDPVLEPPSEAGENKRSC